MAVDIARVRGKEDITEVLSAAEQQQATPTIDEQFSTMTLSSTEIHAERVETTVAATPEKPSPSLTNVTALPEKQALSLSEPSQQPSSDAPTGTPSTSTAEEKTHAVPLPSKQTVGILKQTTVTTGHSLEVYIQV